MGEVVNIKPASATRKCVVNECEKNATQFIGLVDVNSMHPAGTKGFCDDHYEAYQRAADLFGGKNEL